jgi:hypothetical protein
MNSFSDTDSTIIMADIADLFELETAETNDAAEETAENLYAMPSAA